VFEQYGAASIAHNDFSAYIRHCQAQVRGVQFFRNVHFDLFAAINAAMHNFVSLLCFHYRSWYVKFFLQAIKPFYRKIILHSNLVFS
jgi:hypothetical protein